MLLTYLGSILLLLSITALYTLHYVKTGTRVVIERFGKYDRILEPGLHWIKPFVENIKTVRWSRVEETRIGNKHKILTKIYEYKEIPTIQQCHDLPPFSVVTKDRIDIQVNGMLFLRIVDCEKAVYSINDLYKAIENLVESCIRDFCANVNFEKIYASREDLTLFVTKSFSEMSKWGVVIDRFDIQDIDCSQSIKDATEIAMRETRKAEAQIQLIKAQSEAKLIEISTQHKLNKMELENQKQLQSLNLEKECDLVKAQSNLNKIKLESDINKLNSLNQAKCQEISNLLTSGLPTDYFIQEMKTKAWESMASNPNNKIVIPYESCKLLGASHLMHSLISSSPSEKLY